MILSLFDYSGKIKKEFIRQGFDCINLDNRKGRMSKSIDLNIDFLQWDYKNYPRSYFKFLFIALPCQCYSIASAGKHFRDGKIKSSQAVKSINILIKLYQVTMYFNCKFIIENPSGGLINNVFFKQFFSLNVTRITLYNFGFPTQKKTDLFYNFNMLLIAPVTYRVNNKYNPQSLDNLSYNQRVTYPDAFCEWIVLNIIKQNMF